MRRERVNEWAQNAHRKLHFLVRINIEITTAMAAADDDGDVWNCSIVRDTNGYENFWITENDKKM